MKKFTCLVVLLFTGLTGIYADQSVNGGTGLFFARKAEVIDSGSLDAGAFYNFTNFRVEETSFPPRNSDNLVTINCGYGLLGYGELGAVIPVLFNSGYQNESSIGNISIVGKIALPKKPIADLLKIGATIVVSAPTSDKDKLLGSGKVNLLGEANFSLFLQKWSVHLNFGFKEEDYYYEVAPENGISLKPVVEGSLGFLYNPVEFIDLVAELNGKSVKGITPADEDLFALIGVRLKLLDLVSAQAGVGVGLPSIIKKANTDFLLNVGVGIKL
ncbi:MAG TPA: hypothetical protein VII00_07435 [bacterium]